MPDDDAWMLYDLAREDRRTRARLARSQTANQKALAAQEATFSGALTDLSEARLSVGIYTESGVIHRGLISALDREYIEIQGEDQPIVLLATSAIRGLGITDIPKRNVIPSSRELPDNGGLAKRLGELSESLPTVRVLMQNVSDPFTGVLMSVGDDVISVGEPGAKSLDLLPIAAVSEVKILG